MPVQTGRSVPKDQPERSERDLDCVRLLKNDLQDTRYESCEGENRHRTEKNRNVDVIFGERRVQRPGEAFKLYSLFFVGTPPNGDD